MSTFNNSPAIKENRSRDIRNDLIISNSNDRYHHTRLINKELSFISYKLRFSHQILLCETERFRFYFDQSERRNESLTREKIVSSNHKLRFMRIVFSRAFSRSSRVALSGSFHKIIFSVYSSCS